MATQKYTTFFIFIFSCCMSYTTQQLDGDLHNEEKSFSFSLGPSTFYVPEGRFFVGSFENKEHNDFAVAAADRSQTRFSPLTPERVTLNGIAYLPNPLHGAAISHIVMLGL